MGERPLPGLRNHNLLSQGCGDWSEPAAEGPRMPARRGWRGPQTLKYRPPAILTYFTPLLLCPRERWLLAHILVHVGLVRLLCSEPFRREEKRNLAAERVPLGPGTRSPRAVLGEML